MIPTELPEKYPLLTAQPTADGFAVSGTIEAVEALDEYMDGFIPTLYRRGILWVGYESNEAYRSYRVQQ